MVPVGHICKTTFVINNVVGNMEVYGYGLVVDTVRTYSHSFLQVLWYIDRSTKVTVSGWHRTNALTSLPESQITSPFFEPSS